MTTIKQLLLELRYPGRVNGLGNLELLKACIMSSNQIDWGKDSLFSFFVNTLEEIADSPRIRGDEVDIWVQLIERVGKDVAANKKVANLYKEYCVDRLFRTTVTSSSSVGRRFKEELIDSLVKIIGRDALIIAAEENYGAILHAVRSGNVILVKKMIECGCSLDRMTKINVHSRKDLEITMPWCIAGGEEIYDLCVGSIDINKKYDALWHTDGYVKVLKMDMLDMLPLLEMNEFLTEKFESTWLKKLKKSILEPLNDEQSEDKIKEWLLAILDNNNYKSKEDLKERLDALLQDVPSDFNEWKYYGGLSLVQIIRLRYPRAQGIMLEEVLSLENEILKKNEFGFNAIEYGLMSEEYIYGPMAYMDIHKDKSQNGIIVNKFQKEINEAVELMCSVDGFRRMVKESERVQQVVGWQGEPLHRDLMREFMQSKNSPNRPSDTVEALISDAANGMPSKIKTLRNKLENAMNEVDAETTLEEQLKNMRLAIELEEKWDLALTGKSCPWIEDDGSKTIYRMQDIRVQRVREVLTLMTEMQYAPAVGFKMYRTSGWVREESKDCEQIYQAIEEKISEWPDMWTLIKKEIEIKPIGWAHVIGLEKERGDEFFQRLSMIGERCLLNKDAGMSCVKKLSTPVAL